MPNSGDDITGGAAIQPITDAPEAFAGLAAKLNEVIAKLNSHNLKAGHGFTITKGTHGKLLNFSPKLPAKRLDLQLNADAILSSGAGGGQATSVAGYTDQTLTVCVSGVTKTMHVLGTTPV